MTKKFRILFICKKRSTYGVSYGLLNSCRFLVNALVDMGYEAKVVEVNDNNDINREVFTYKPTHVFIEALWVVPSKFEEIIPLYPKIKWYVRLHSNTPFLSNEGMAIEWIMKYLALGVKYSNFKLAPNSIHMVDDLKDTFNVNPVYAPNIYLPSTKIDVPMNHSTMTADAHKVNTAKVVNIGCFGAIRPLKNQLIQAMAAIAFSNKTNKQLIFHINSARIETQGEPIIRNIEALFASTHHKLVIHDWLDHTEFLNLIQTMDLGLQVSFSETFNIVAADFAYLNVPIVGSKEIEWMSNLFKANPTNLEDIADKLNFAWIGKKLGLQVQNRIGLHEWNEDARKVWKNLLNG